MQITIDNSIVFRIHRIFALFSTVFSYAKGTFPLSFKAIHPEHTKHLANKHPTIHTHIEWLLCCIFALVQKESKGLFFILSQCQLSGEWKSVQFYPYLHFVWNHRCNRFDIVHSILWFNGIFWCATKHTLNRFESQTEAKIRMKIFKHGKPNAQNTHSAFVFNLFHPFFVYILFVERKPSTIFLFFSLSRLVW